MNKENCCIENHKCYVPVSKVKVRYASGEEKEVDEGWAILRSAEWHSPGWPMFLINFLYPFRRFLMKRRWAKEGNPVVVVPGYNCGCCGKWVNEEKETPTYQFVDSWWNTWGLCPEGLEACYNKEEVK